ncbi:MAG: ABC transporter transmembrane domain-containing protein, partial [Anaerolineaceae bacterium]
MGYRGMGWWGYLQSGDEKPRVTRSLLLRVFKYSKPYRWHLAAMLVCILASAGLGLLVPLILRDLIDHTLPAGDLPRLIRLALALLAVPILNSLVSVIQRQLNARVGEGVIYDLRSELYGHLQRMSLRFFTHTRVGELMSRLNSDVVGAQNAVNSTLVSLISDVIQAAALLAVMLSLEWRLTLVSIVILPLFFLAARYMGSKLRVIARRQMQVNAEMNAMVNETLNIGGSLLV